MIIDFGKYNNKRKRKPRLGLVRAILTPIEQLKTAVTSHTLLQTQDKHVAFSYNQQPVTS